MITMMALILAGGRGERLRPLTDKIPKPLLPVKGKPLLEWQVELLKKYRINEIMICGHYMFDKIKEYFGTGARFGVNIKYIYEEVPLGTGGAMKNAESEINSTVVVIYGDIFTDINIKNLLTFHKSKKADATINKLGLLDKKLSVKGADKERYIKITSQISCEYCCGVESIIFENGEAACGCNHSFAMRGLAKYLILNHGSEFTDDQILEELGKWKTLFFPTQMTKKAAVLQSKGIELNYINLASNKYRGAEQGATGQMVGGC